MIRSNCISLFSIPHRVDLSDLRPEETPCISFRSETAKLQDTIMSYGRVLPTGLPMPSAFVDHGHPSTCLPRHFEDYEDGEHHVLYKTLEAVNRANTIDGSVSISSFGLAYNTCTPI